MTQTPMRPHDLRQLQRSGDRGLIAVFAEMPHEAQAIFRRACRAAAEHEPDARAAVWRGLSDLSFQTSWEKALRKCPDAELATLRDMFHGAALVWWERSRHLWSAWMVAGNTVKDVLDARTPSVAPTPVPGPPPRRATPRLSRRKSLNPPKLKPVEQSPRVRRSDAILEMLAEHPEGLPTLAISSRLGGEPARQALRRLRQASKVETRDGLNFIVAVTGIPTVDVRQSA